MSDAAPPPADPMSIRVMIVDDHEVFSASLAMVLEAEPDLTVVGIAATAAEAVAKAAAIQPDVVLLDHRLPDGDGIALIAPLLALDPAPQVVMLTASTADHVLISAIEAGAAGFVDKSRSLGEVLSSVRSAAAGEASVSPAMLARLLPRLRRRATDPAWTLTEREREVLTHLANGLSNAEIAQQMFVSVHTVRNHVANLSAKLGAHSKLEVLSIAIREGLING
ncbi:MAG TPA: response regulator transcription factor [Jatrophihabitans sp.]|jgi:DNA-binding NarL/FixJ family response regulator|uniref:response regulator transcription factor n=1 Tax=Jatrophihabitans sp. TaxID=1932789 RepID=UPI002DFB6290|nr:response regulator transcription factor [Jatrophihabitans sp.]